MELTDYRLVIKSREGEVRKNKCFNTAITCNYPLDYYEYDGKDSYTFPGFKDGVYLAAGMTVTLVVERLVYNNYHRDFNWIQEKI